MTFAEVCLNTYLHGPKSGEIGRDALLPVTLLVWTVFKAAERGPMSQIMQQYIPGIVSQDTGELHLLEGQPGDYWQRRYRRRKAAMMQEIQDRIDIPLLDLTESNFRILQQNVVYHQLLEDSVDPENATLMPFLYNIKDVSWCQQRLGWSLPVVGYKMMRVVSKCLSRDDHQKGLYYSYTSTLHSDVFRQAAYRFHTEDKSCASCGVSPAAGQSHRRCSGCGISKYCNKKCQKRDWKQGHKHECCEELKLLFVIEPHERQHLVRILDDV